MKGEVEVADTPTPSPPPSAPPFKAAAPIMGKVEWAAGELACLRREIRGREGGGWTKEDSKGPF